jgi:cobalamin synthase
MTDQQNTEQTPATENKRKKFNFWPVIGAVLGAIGGYIYYIQVGCNSGSCGITSNPYMSMLWGAAMGYLLFDLFTRKPRRRKSEF